MSFPEKPHGRARRAARSVLLQVSSRIAMVRWLRPAKKLCERWTPQPLSRQAHFSSTGISYLLPLALAAHRGAEDAAEFQKIVEHRGIVVSDPIGGLAFLQLARAYSTSGDRTRAKSAHGDFLKLWKGADPKSQSWNKPRLSTRLCNSCIPSGMVVRRDSVVDSYRKTCCLNYNDTRFTRT
jgi:hypothetical protein